MRKLLHEFKYSLFIYKDYSENEFSAKQLPRSNMVDWGWA